MPNNKFFEKFLENISHQDESKIKFIVESLESERRIFKDILDHSDEAIIIINENRIFFLNQSAKKLLMTPRIVKIPALTDELKKLAGNQVLFDCIISSLPKSDFKAEFSDNAKETRYYYFEKVTLGDNIFLIKLKDISEKKKIDFQLKNAESVSALNTLAAGIAHEIKNPLTAIDLHTQILKKGIHKKIIEVPPEVNNYIQIVDEEQHRLAKIVNDFLTAARKRELKLTFENINQYLKNIIFLIKPEIEKNEIELIEDYNDVPKLFFDRDYLKQAIINLLKNAIESMSTSAVDPNNDKILTICTFFDNATDSIGISISDTGSGIDSEKIQKIFEPYFSTKEYGTGLGLTIVYKIIKEHGGDIKVESTKGKGSKFTLYIPLSKGTKMITRK